MLKDKIINIINDKYPNNEIVNIYKDNIECKLHRDDKYHYKIYTIDDVDITSNVIIPDCRVMKYNELYEYVKNMEELLQTLNDGGIFV